MNIDGEHLHSNNSENLASSLALFLTAVIVSVSLVFTFVNLYSPILSLVSNGVLAVVLTLVATAMLFRSILYILRMFGVK